MAGVVPNSGRHFGRGAGSGVPAALADAFVTTD
jgi:hypothetical protein